MIDGLIFTLILRLESSIRGNLLSFERIDNVVVVLAAVMTTNEKRA